MNYKFDSNFIENIIDKTNITSVILSKLDFKKKIGKYIFILCPFHNDKNPSFSINEEKKFYYCFGCKSHGNVINFLMNFEKLNFIESILKLSKINNLNINNYNYKINKKLYNFYILTKKMSLLYHKNIFIKKNYNFINKYFKEKKWRIEIIKLFRVGYSSIDIINNIIKNKKIIYNLCKLNLIIKNYNNKYYDIMNNRIIFPMYNEYGNIIAFGGRAIKNLNSKYINSKESIIFKKKKYIYGLYQIKKIYKYGMIPKLLLVEGYTDVISLFNFGINYSISTLGCGLTDYQIIKIFKNTNELIFCYDGDDAGYKSNISSFKKILPYLTDDKIIKFIILPKNEDPDSIINKIGFNKFNELINSSIDISIFLFRFIIKINNLLIYNKINIINKFIKIIKIIPSNLIKFFLKKKLCNKLNIKIYEFDKIFKKKCNFNNIFYKNINKNYPILIGINLLIKKPILYKFVDFNIIKKNNLDNKYILFFIKLIYICYKYKLDNTNKLFYILKNKNIFKKIYKIYNMNTMINTKKTNEVFIDIMNKVYLFFFEKDKNILINKYKLLGLNNIEKSKLIILNKKIFRLNNQIKYNNNL